MQKMITITIDTKMLSRDSSDVFTITEVHEVNDLLESGWNLEEWKLLDESESGKRILIAILNDDEIMDEEEFDYAAFSSVEHSEDDKEEPHVD